MRGYRGRWTAVAMAAALTAVVAVGEARADRFDDIEVRTQELAEGVYMLRGAGGNVIACTDERGVLLIDSDYDRMSGKLQAAVADLDSGPVAMVVNTHWHFDHVGGNAALGEGGALIVAHANARAHMSAPQHLDVIDADTEAFPDAALPVVCVRDGLDLHWGGRELRIRRLPPAHTDTDLWIHIPDADVVHTGDVFFNAGYPYIDTAHGGNVDGMIAAAERILAVCGPQTKIVPGHGPLGNRDELAAYIDALRGFAGIVKEQIAAGATLEEIVAARKTAAIDAEWGERMFPPEAFAEMVWLSVQGAED